MAESREPESLVAPIAKPVPKADASAATQTPVPPNRIPTMPPRPTAPEIPRPVDVLRRPSELATPATIERAGSPGSSPLPAFKTEPGSRQMIVGRDISLQGEIKTCDVLIVEGTIEATLPSCREMKIGETGLFHGTATVQDAEIRGRYQGDLTVQNRLLVRASGSVVGTVRYGQIEVECGGRIAGEFHVEPATAREEQPAPTQHTVEPILATAEH